MKNPVTVILFGKSGAGKGTQAELLLKDLKFADKNRDVLYVETGQRFRNFINKTDNFTANRIKEVLAQGKLLPAFLPVWTWTGFLVDEFKGGEHLVFDGLCRQPEESPILDSALQFYGREKPIVLLLDVNDNEAKTRLLKRGRYDDKHEKIDERLGWFVTNVVPAIEYFRKSPTVKFVTIDGNQTIEKVHQDIVKALGIKCAPADAPAA